MEKKKWKRIEIWYEGEYHKDRVVIERKDYEKIDSLKDTLEILSEARDLFRRLSRALGER